MHDIFDAAVVHTLTERIRRLTPESRPLWGKMTVDQMLAHCNVPYAMVYENTYPPIGPFKRFLLRTFVKGGVVGPRPYPRNSPTAPEFRMSGARDFPRERDRLIAFMQRVQQEGATAFDGRESRSFGPLTTAERSVLFSKHLDHHLSQIDV